MMTGEMAEEGKKENTTHAHSGKVQTPEGGPARLCPGPGSPRPTPELAPGKVRRQDGLLVSDGGRSRPGTRLPRPGTGKGPGQGPCRPCHRKAGLRRLAPAVPTQRQGADQGCCRQAWLRGEGRQTLPLLLRSPLPRGPAKAPASCYRPEKHSLGPRAGPGAPQGCFPASTCRSADPEPGCPAILGSSKRLDREKKASLGGGGRRVLFRRCAPAPGRCQTVLDEIRKQGQGPSPGPSGSHCAQDKVQGRFPAPWPTHTLLMTREREARWGQWGSWVGVGPSWGSMGWWQAEPSGLGQQV